jgi:hypothetical protein
MRIAQISEHGEVGAPEVRYEIEAPSDTSKTARNLSAWLSAVAGIDRAFSFKSRRGVENPVFTGTLGSHFDMSDKEAVNIAMKHASSWGMVTLTGNVALEGSGMNTTFENGRVLVAEPSMGEKEQANGMNIHVIGLNQDQLVSEMTIPAKVLQEVVFTVVDGTNLPTIDQVASRGIVSA